METSNLKEKWINTGSGKIFYFVDEIFPNRPFVIFIHGLSSNYTTWLQTIALIHEHKFNSLAIELRGHGLSDKSKIKSLYKISVMSDDLNQIIEKEKIDKGFIVGYSYGGPIAIDYAIKHPEFLLGLVLISSNYVSPFFYKKLDFLTPIAYGFLNLLAFLLLWQKRKKYYYKKHEEFRGYWHSVWIGLNTMPLSINFWMLSQMFKIDFRKSIKNIHAPTLIIRARKDTFLSKAEAEGMAQAIPNAEIITPKHINHFMAWRSRDETAEVILNFLKTYAQ